jgi:CubicO group peptidase (beta-lactamase class C family)
MRDTVAFEASRSTVAHRAYGYSDVGGSWVRTDQDLTSATLGDGGVYSSLNDLAQWDAALHDDRLLRPASLELAFQAATATDEPGVQYGFGWRISGDTRWHSGETTGFRNVIVRCLKRRITVIVLTNRNGPEPYLTALAIAGLPGYGPRPSAS